MVIYQSSLIHLEKLSKSHELSTFSWLSDPVLRDMFFMRGDVDWAGHQAYFDRVLNDDSQRLFAIMRGSEHIGNCGLKHIDTTQKTAEMWIYIGDPEWRGRGIGAKALAALMEEGFRGTEIDLIYLHVAKENGAALSLYKAYGFILTEQIAPEWQAHASAVVRMTLKRPAI